MIAICVDDEPILLKWLVKKVENSKKIETVVGFLTEEDAISYAESHPFDMAFLDVELGAMGGIALAKRLKEISPRAGIVFCTGHANYAVDAIGAVAVNGYLLKPIEDEAVLREIERFKKTVKKREPLTVDLSRGTEALNDDGTPVVFKRTKTVELLAVLAKRGGESVSVREICDALWEGNEDAYLFEKNRQYLMQLLLDLRRTLTRLGYSDPVKKTSAGYAAVMSQIRLKR